MLDRIVHTLGTRTKVTTHLILAECCWFATSAVFDVPYETPSVLVAAVTPLLPLHSLIALILLNALLAPPLWWLVGWLAPATAVFVTFALGFALLFYPVSRVGFDGLIYRMGGDDQFYGKVTQVTDGDT